MIRKNKKIKPNQTSKKPSKLKVFGAQLKVKSCALYHTYRIRVARSLRLQIFLMVAVGLVLSGLAGAMTSEIARNIGIGKQGYDEYNFSNEEHQRNLEETIRNINTLYSATPLIKIDDEVYKEVLSFTDPLEALSGLREQLAYFYSFEYNTAYSSYNGLQDQLRDKVYELPDKQIEGMYNKLLELKDKGTWTKEAIETTIEGAFDELGITEVNLKESALKEILSTFDNSLYYVTESQTYLTDSKGNVLYGDNFIKKIDLAETIRNASTLNGNQGNNKEVNSMYPVIMDDAIYYLFNKSTLQGQYNIIYDDTSNVLGGFVGVITFILIVLQATKRKMKYIEYLALCLGEISKGDLDYVVEQRGQDELGQVAVAMTHMEARLKEQMLERMQAENTKNELITNVAHDLRTPLTSVIGYIGLVKDKKFTSEEEEGKFLEIAYNKSEKLKILIEDLFEYTKLSNRTVELKREQMSVSTLLNQLIEELIPLAEEKDIDIKFQVAARQTNVSVDVLKMTRVFENLIENAIKYSPKHSKIQVAIQEARDYVYITVRNSCEEVPEQDMNKLFDRFYRTDHSRNSTTGGSGLGLAIAKNIVEMHQGKIWAQLDGNFINFNVKLRKA